MSRQTAVVEYYLEIEPFNIRPCESKITFTCNCGRKVLRSSSLKEQDFGTQKFCECGKLIYTVSKKITWREYVSGKTGS